LNGVGDPAHNPEAPLERVYVECPRHFNRHWAFYRAGRLVSGCPECEYNSLRARLRRLLGGIWSWVRWPAFFLLLIVLVVLKPGMMLVRGLCRR
jgi:hypothetical protein